MSCRVLFLAGIDYANMLSIISRSINRAVGEKVSRVILAEQHGKYGKDLIWSDETCVEARSVAEEAEWIVVNVNSEFGWGSAAAMLRRLGLNLSKKKVAVTHSGSEFSLREDVACGAQRVFVGCWCMEQADVLMSGDLAVPYVTAAPLEIDKPAVLDAKIKISHSPTSRTLKGTDIILSVLNSIQGIEVVLLENLRLYDCIERRGQTHIFVDQINSVGGFGCSSIEAMASGCAVLCDISRTSLRAWQFIPKPPILHIGSAGVLRETINNLVRDGGRLEELRHESIAWSKRNTYPEAIAIYWAMQLGVQW